MTSRRGPEGPRLTLLPSVGLHPDPATVHNRSTSRPLRNRQQDMLLVGRGSALPEPDSSAQLTMELDGTDQLGERYEEYEDER